MFSDFGDWLGLVLVIVSAVLTIRNFLYSMQLRSELLRYLKRRHPDFWGDADENVFRMFPVGKDSIVTLIFSKENFGDPLLEKKKRAFKVQFFVAYLYLVGTGLMWMFVTYFFWWR